MRKWIHICFPQYFCNLCWIIMIENNFYLFICLFIIFGCAYGLKKVILEKNLCSSKNIWDMLDLFEITRWGIENQEYFNLVQISKRPVFPLFYMKSKCLDLVFNYIKSEYQIYIYIYTYFDKWKWIILSDINKKSSCILFIFFFVANLIF